MSVLTGTSMGPPHPIIAVKWTSCNSASRILSVAFENDSDIVLYKTKGITLRTVPYLFLRRMSAAEKRDARTLPVTVPTQQVIGHFCHGLSQSKGIGQAPTQAPTRAPAALMNRTRAKRSAEVPLVCSTHHFNIVAILGALMLFGGNCWRE